MAGKDDAEEQAKRLETLSVERRRLIGQAIIDGVLSLKDISFSPVAADPDYNQGQSGYTQKGGDHKQGGGDYNQSAILRNMFESVILEIQSGRVIRE
jgi:hypothetical protein